jgi:hypothetical protein
MIRISVKSDISSLGILSITDVMYFSELNATIKMATFFDFNISIELDHSSAEISVFA